MTDPTVRIVADAISQHPCRRDEDNHTAETCPTAVAVLDALKTAGLLRQGDTVPVDRDLIKPLRDICRELGYLGLLRRLPNSDQEPQP